MTVKQVKFGQCLGSEGALGHADGPMVEAADDLDTEKMMDWPLALQFDVKL